jgi:glucose-1-phosphate thymidylyltransferase
MKNELVGLIPAAGGAIRVSPLPGSKELFPIGFREIKVDGRMQLRPKVVSQYVMDNMYYAGARKIFILLGKGKTDIMHYYGSGKDFKGHIAYLLDDNIRGLPYTLDLARPWVRENTVLFGMPDTIFTPTDAFARVLAKHRETNSDVTLGIFPTNRPENLCPVELDELGQVLSMVDKPADTNIENTWGCACWNSRFTGFMHDYLKSRSVNGKEAILADVFLGALRQGLSMFGLFFADGEYIDVGTPDDLVVAVKRFSNDI